MAFLNVTDPTAIKVLRKGMIEWGFRGLALGHQLFKRMGRCARERQPALPASTGGAMRFNEAVRALYEAADAGSIAEADNAGHAGTGGRRHRSRSCATRPESTTTRMRSFIFPAAAPSAFSAKSGWPARHALRAGESDCAAPGISLLRLSSELRPAAATRDRQYHVPKTGCLFHRVANTLNYMDIKTVIVSCGTCMDQLHGIPVRADFPRLPAAGYPRVSDGERGGAGGRGGQPVPLPRSLSLRR